VHSLEHVLVTEAGFLPYSPFQHSEVRLKSAFLQASGASGSEFNHANIILCLKVGMLVYEVSRLSKYQGYLLIACLFHGPLLVVTEKPIVLSIDTQYVETTTLMRRNSA